MNIEILGIKISLLKKADLLNIISPKLANAEVKNPLFIATVNSEMIMKAQIDKNFKTILNQASIQTPDSAGIVWAANLLFKKKLERIAGADLLIDIAFLAAKYNLGLFLLGGKKGIAEKAAERLKKKIPSLKKINTFSGNPFLNLKNFPAQVKAAIQQSQIIFVAYGSPAQEKWIARNLPFLPNCKTIMGVGGSFDFLAGKLKRAPRYLQKIGLEWFYRLCQEPWRLRRMSILPIFVFKIFKTKIFSFKKPRR